MAFRVTKVQVEAESEAPQACLRFNEKIATKGDVSHAAFVRSEPGFDGVVTVRGDTLCVNGLRHGETYELRLLAGFPAETGERTAETFTARIVVPDRKPSISFAGTGYVLPQRDTAGLPVTTVNLDRVKVRLLRVNERNLVPSLDAEKLTMKFDSYDVDQVIERTGKLVWQGEMSISGKRNTPGDDRDPAEGHAARQRPRRLPRRRRADRFAPERVRAPGDQLGAGVGSWPDRLQRGRRNGGRGPLACRRRSRFPASPCGSMPATTASWRA